MATDDARTRPAVLPYVLLQTSNDSHAHRIYTTLAASENRRLYAHCLSGRFECARVLRPFPDTVLLCGVSGTEREFLALLRETHLGTKVFRVYFCNQPPTADAAAVTAFYGERADGLVCRMQCYPRRYYCLLSVCLSVCLSNPTRAAWRRRWVRRSR